MGAQDQRRKVRRSTYLPGSPLRYAHRDGPSVGPRDLELNGTQDDRRGLAGGSRIRGARRRIGSLMRSRTAKPLAHAPDDADHHGRKDEPPPHPGRPQATLLDRRSGTGVGNRIWPCRFVAFSPPGFEIGRAFGLHECGVRALPMLQIVLKRENRIPRPTPLPPDRKTAFAFPPPGCSLGCPKECRDVLPASDLIPARHVAGSPSQVTARRDHITAIPRSPRG